MSNPSQSQTTASSSLASQQVKATLMLLADGSSQYQEVV